MLRWGGREKEMGFFLMPAGASSSMEEEEEEEDEEEVKEKEEVGFSMGEEEEGKLLREQLYFLP